MKKIIKTSKYLKELWTFEKIRKTWVSNVWKKSEYLKKTCLDNSKRRCTILKDFHMGMNTFAITYSIRLTENHNNDIKMYFALS